MTTENIAQKLRQAYDLIADADTNDIDAYCLSVEEAHGYVAEALDLADSAPTNVNKLEVASRLKSAISWYVDVTIEEHANAKINPEADEAWDLIVQSINELVEAS